MSPEEIIALMPQDLDFDKKLIKIRRAITNGILSQDTKTVFRTRTIPLFGSALHYLLNQMEHAKSKRSLFLFCKETASDTVIQGRSEDSARIPINGMGL